MADIDYPCKLPGVLVNSNSYSPNDRVTRNDLSAGPPLFIRRDDDGFVMFDVAWSFDALECQVFQSFFRSVLASGSKLFNVELWIDGSDGTKQTKTHECYFNGPPAYVQNGRRWAVSAQLLAIKEQTLSECAGISLVNAYNGFSYPLSQAISDMAATILLLEDRWQP